MKKEAWHLDKRVPVTIILAIVVQTIGIVIWAAKLDAATTGNTLEITKHDVRLGKLEGTNITIIERLARIEANQENQLAVSREIKQRLERR